MRETCILNGPKVSKKHGTLTRLALLLSRIAQQCEYVRKISLGLITAHRSKQIIVVLQRMSGGILVLVYDGRTRQNITVYTSDISATIKYMIDNARKRDIEVTYTP